MATIGRNGKLYQERKQPENRNTRRGPGPQWDPAQNTTHVIPLESPLPLPAFLDDTNPPEAFKATEPWPNGEESII